MGVPAPPWWVSGMGGTSDPGAECGPSPPGPAGGQQPRWWVWPEPTSLQCQGRQGSVGRLQCVHSLRMASSTWRALCGGLRWDRSAHRRLHTPYSGVWGHACARPLQSAGGYIAHALTAWPHLPGKASPQPPQLSPQNKTDLSKQMRTQDGLTTSLSRSCRSLSLTPRRAQDQMHGLAPPAYLGGILVMRRHFHPFLGTDQAVVSAPPPETSCCPALA